MTMNVGMVFINCHYRYTTVKSRLNSKSFHWIWSYTLINLIVITIAIGCALAFNNGKSIQADEIEGICFPKSFNNFLYTENKNLYNKVLFTAILAAFILAYVGSSVFNRKTLNLLKNNLRFQNERTLSMQSQLSKVIIVQSLVQLAASVGPVTLICVCILTNTEATIDMLIFGCISWLPLFNSAATIIIIKPYRRRLMAMWRQKTLCVSMTHVSHLHYMSSNWQSKTFTSR
ncbi:unnamed protein product [Bursaphelenchus okinawaensis]|uniref:G_PROTEIN_RECEP_F1_2 domain-containing protein n=1 Tax=Bursaphelenchus okinawaensis TaxID=465554 RepID=A0A811L302_9BILA|nr:unnamed protein product [Bursaphelenchus okinawaensis]CAG9115152.1 unnamed protein product [Bursaphelenchus okinawaensis]